VLGASGFIGKYLIRHLAEQDVETVGVASKDIDLCRPESVGQLQELIRPDDAVVFASALTPDRGRNRATMLKNIAMGDHVCQALEKSACAQLVYISTDAVYRDGEHPIREDSCCNPSSLYGLGHLAREEMVKEVAGRVGIRLAILRPCAVYGPGDTHNSYGPNRFLRTAISDGKIVLFGQGEEKRHHIFIQDLSHFITLCLTYRSEGVINIAPDTAFSFFEIAQIISNLFESRAEIEYLPRQAPITHKHFDITAALKAFPSFRYTTLQTGLSLSLEGMMSHSND
jgi:nucleoside-diphosphate-sugar epimerase